MSQHVKALENELGVRLFDRSNRGVTLTPAGQVLYDETRAVLRRLEHAKIKARHAGLGEIGTLAIGFVSIAGYGILPPALKRFRERFPRVDVQLHELTTDAQIRALRDGRLDLGIGLGPVDEQDLMFDPVRGDRLLLAAPVGHRRVPRSGAVRLGTLSNEPFIVPPRDVAPGLYDLIISLCRANGFAPNITQHARQMQTVIALVAGGMGFALVPESVRKLERAGVQYRSLRGETGSIELGLLSATEHESPVAERFAAVLKRAAGAARRG